MIKAHNDTHDSQQNDQWVELANNDDDFNVIQLDNDDNNPPDHPMHDDNNSSEHENED